MSCKTIFSMAKFRKFCNKSLRLGFTISMASKEDYQLVYLNERQDLDKLLAYNNTAENELEESQKTKLLILNEMKKIKEKHNSTQYFLESALEENSQLKDMAQKSKTRDKLQSKMQSVRNDIDMYFSRAENFVTDMNEKQNELCEVNEKMEKQVQKLLFVQEQILEQEKSVNKAKQEYLEHAMKD